MGRRNSKSFINKAFERAYYENYSMVSEGHTVYI